MTQEELTPRVHVMEAEVLMCDVYGPLRVPSLTSLSLSFQFECSCESKWFVVYFTSLSIFGPCIVEWWGFGRKRFWSCLGRIPEFTWKECRKPQIPTLTIADVLLEIRTHVLRTRAKSVSFASACSVEECEPSLLWSFAVLSLPCIFL